MATDLIPRTGENFIDRAADEVRRMGGDVKEAAEDAAGKTSGRDTAKGGYDSPEMSGVNGAGGLYRNGRRIPDGYGLLI